MARVNVNILGINKLKWTGMDEFNSDDHYIYYCGEFIFQYPIILPFHTVHGVLKARILKGRRCPICYWKSVEK